MIVESKFHKTKVPFDKIMFVNLLSECKIKMKLNRITKKNFNYNYKRL